MKTKTTKLFYCVLIFVSLAVGKAAAQMVYLPDTNFRNALIAEGYGAAIYGDSLDGGDSLVINTSTLYVNNYGINDLTGIESFVNLQTFVCSTNLLATLPQLPTSLINLYCNDNQLTFLPQLPSNLQWLDCSGNLLTSLPGLPNTLTNVTCSKNSITMLPALSVALTVLNCSHNQLTALPSLPLGLNSLICSYNQLTALPSIPASLNALVCTANQLTSLPALPNVHYNTIECSLNLLTSLQNLPDTVFNLFCGGNQISVLPTLSPYLQEFDCGGNLLTSLPPLPANLIGIICDNNINLSCLPQLHDMLYLTFTSTAISCIPNYANISICNPPLNSLPLCNIFNANGCDFYWNISGQTYLDSNANCVFDGGDFNIKNIPLQLLSNGNLIQQTSSALFGKYDFDTDSNGIYEVKVDTNDLPFDIICPGSNFYSDTITSTDSLKTNRDFTLQCKNGLYGGIRGIYGRFAPGRFSTVNIHVEDLALFYGMHCASGESGAVTVRLDGPVTYISPAPGALTPTTVSGNLLTYIVPDFGALYIGAFDIIVQTDTFATIGTQVCITVTTITTNSSSNIQKDSLTQCFTIVGSFDPNDKQVSPVSDIDINGDGWLIYTINFQNTGTAQAYDIYLLDTLDNNLDWSTFKLTAYSHQPQVQLFNTGLLRFNFPNINLPDSNTNEPLSNG